MGINYKQCPKCGSKNTLKILYGMPTKEVFQKQKQEKLNQVDAEKQLVAQNTTVKIVRVNGIKNRLLMLLIIKSRD